MLLKLITDARDILLLRYKPAEDYRYSAGAVIGILLLLGMQNAAAFVPLLGREPAAIAFSIIFVSLKWLLLSKTMQMVLNGKGGPKQPFTGFILASEALLAPTIAMVYFPSLSAIAVFWQIWCFWAQAAGLMALSKTNGLKVLIGYALYLVTMILAAGILISLFISAGFFDQTELMERSQQIFKLSPMSKP